MRRLQVSIDDAIDDKITADAAKRGISKSALMRQLLADRFGRDRTREALDRLANLPAFDREDAWR